jgi:hypothetical protein
MNKAKTKLLGKALVACLILNCSNIQAQLQPKTLRVGILNESISLPSWQLIKLPIHPTLNVGVDLREKGGTHWKRTFGTDAYYYYHRQIEHAIMLDASYRIGYQFKSGLKPYFQLLLAINMPF